MRLRVSWSNCASGRPDCLTLGDLDRLLASDAFFARKIDGSVDADLLARALNPAVERIDRSLREIGVGDLRVGKRIRQMAQAFYGRARHYDDAVVS